MRTILFFIFVGLGIAQRASASGPEKMTYGKFGEIVLFRNASQPRKLIFVVSGDRGWDQESELLARSVLQDGVVVAGLSLPTYLKQPSKKCLYPAGDFEILSKFLQKTLVFKEYAPPVLVGLSSGAAFSYATMAQAPAGTFNGVVSIGFCPELSSKVSFCKRSGLESQISKTRTTLMSSRENKTRWSVLHVEGESKCALPSVQAFTKSTPNASLVPIPKSSSGEFQSQRIGQTLKNEISRFLLADELPAKMDSLSDLPLVVMPAPAPKGDAFIVFLSGDGGWAGFDRDLARRFVARGVPVVGFNSLRYFWEAKTVERGARDLERIVLEFSKEWKKARVIVVGFSFGADVVAPFVNRLPEKVRTQIQKVVLISVGPLAAFEFHFTDWIKPRNDGLQLVPEVAALAKTTPVICVYGQDEEFESGCPSFRGDKVEIVSLRGGHHVDLTDDHVNRFLR